MRTILASALLCCCWAVPAARGDTLLQNNAQVGTLIFGSYIGQAFTIPGAGTYNNLAFSFYNGSLDPFAVGTAFLFDTPYLGTPAELSAASPGLLGSGVALGNEYTFDPGLSLEGGETYYLYENAFVPAYTLDAAGPNVQGQYVLSTMVSYGTYGDIGFSSGFILTGAPAAQTPEPVGVGLLGTGLMALAGLLRSRFRMSG